MTESQATTFYRAMLKSAPSLAELPQKEAVKRLQDVFRVVFNITATREHILTALAEHKGNRIKRSWDLKQRYVVSVLLRDPAVDDKAILRCLKLNFRQRTRTSVLLSCRQEAVRMQQECSAAEISAFELKLQQAMLKHAKEGDVLT